VLNFFPAGTGGMPISSEFLLAVQAFPLGGRRCLGRVLAVHCPDDQSLTYEFAHRFLDDNRKLLLLAQRSGEKYEDAKAPRTLIIDALLEIARRRQDWTAARGRPPSLAVYHLTNSGQGPDINVLELPSQVILFVALALRAGTAGAWNAIIARAWESPARSKKNGAERRAKNGDGAPEAGRNRNFLYDDLFELPARAPQFIRTYFLRRGWRSLLKNDPRGDYSYARDLDFVSWPLTELFLKEVVGMERSRIEAIRTVADRIALHIDSTNDDRLFRRLSLVRRYDGLRTRLLRASGERVAVGKDPLISFDEFIVIFENSEEVPRLDWHLAHDLLLIRLLDRLKDRFRRQPEVLEAIVEEDEEEEKAEAASLRGLTN
jgi:CRISPR-associated protein Cst1